MIVHQYATLYLASVRNAEKYTFVHLLLHRCANVWNGWLHDMPVNRPAVRGVASRVFPH